MIEIYKNRTLSIILTYKCTAMCSNCGTFSTPFDKSRVDFEAVQNAILEAKTLNFSNVVFTGGEATIELENLLQGIQFAKEQGFLVRLVTNAHWAKSEKETKELLSRFISLGLDEINFSTGDEHLKFVPIENIVFATSISTNLRLKNVLMFEERENSKSSIEEIEKRIKQNTNLELFSKYFKIIRSPWMPLNPRTKSNQTSDQLLNADNITMQTGCDSVLQTYVLQGDGKIASCCGLGMRHIEELHSTNIHQDNFLENAIEISENDWIKIALRQIGPEKILAWAATKNNSIAWENIYSHRCQACIRLYKDPVVINTILENFDSLKTDLLSTMLIDKSMEKNYC